MSETISPAAPILVPEKTKKPAPVTEADISECRKALSIATMYLLCPPSQAGKSSDKSFYGNLLMRMNVDITNKVPTAGVNVTDRINLYVNPKFFMGLSLTKQVELIVHECEHVMNLHMLRAKNLGIDKNRNLHKLFNIATDANINVTLTNLTEDRGVTIERVNKELEQMKSKYRLDPKDYAEVHYEKLKLIQQEMKEKGQGMPDVGEGEIDDHEIWEESVDNEEMAKAVIKESVNKAAEATGVGNLPSHILSQLNKLNEASVNWKKQMQQFAVQTLKFAREKTRNKRNRRFGYIQQGSRKKPQVKLAVCCDSSGSVSNASFEQFFAEIDAISALGIEITVIDADCGVAAVYEYDRKKKVQRYGNGGTAYGPAINKAKELKVDGIIYFGDMDASDTPADPKIPFLWAIVGNQNPPANFGRTIRVIEKQG